MSNNTASNDYRELTANWRLLLAAIVGTGLSMTSLPFFTIGILAPVFERQFGWQFGQIMGGLFLLSVIVLLLGPFIGFALDRVGARRIATGSLILLGFSYMTLALGNGSLARYYGSWLAISVLGIGATVISFTHAINITFVARRGTALGIALTGSGLSALILKPVAAAIIASQGWATAVIFLGCLPIVLAAPLAWWALPRGGESARHDKAERATPMVGLTVAEAVRSRSFWTLIAAFAPIALANGAPIPNMEKILIELGHGPTALVTLTALIGAGIILGRLVGGWLIDRFFAPFVGSILLIGAAGGCFLLSLPGGGFASAFVAILLLSLAAGLEYDLLAFLVARYIGLRSYGRIYGIMFGIFAIGAGGGPALLGHAYDVSDSYAPGLRICALALVFAAAVLSTIGRYPQLEAEPAA